MKHCNFFRMFFPSRVKSKRETSNTYIIKVLAKKTKKRFSSLLSAFSSAFMRTKNFFNYSKRKNQKCLQSVLHSESISVVFVGIKHSAVSAFECNASI